MFGPSIEGMGSSTWEKPRVGYLQKIPDTLEETSGFCYGQKSVDAIVNWTEPAIAEQHCSLSGEARSSPIVRPEDVAEKVRRARIQPRA
jgi:hypothetical protein